MTILDQCKADCPICGGIGFIRYNVPLGDPKFGKIFPCPSIDITLLVGSQSGLDNSEFGLRWEHILEVKEVLPAKRAVQSLVEKGYGWLYLWGDYGTAKTQLLKVATVQTLLSRKQAVYARMTDILDYLRASFDEESPNQTALNRLEWYSELDGLMIDELDRLNETPWASEKRFSLIDKRYELAIRKKGFTIFASNKPPSAYEGYISDRLSDGRFQVIRIEGTSSRPAIEWDTPIYPKAKSDEPEECPDCHAWITANRTCKCPGKYNTLESTIKVEREASQEGVWDRGNEGVWDRGE